MNVASIKAKTAINAIKLAAIPTTAPTAFDAPKEIASKTFLASLYHETISTKKLRNIFSPNVCYPFGRFFIASQVALVFLVSGRIVFEMARAPGAAIIEATTK